MKARIFHSDEAYEAALDFDFDNGTGYNRINILKTDKKIEFEVEYEMKSIHCAIKRFMKEIPEEFAFARDFEENMRWVVLEAPENERGTHDEWGLRDEWGEYGPDDWMAWDVESNGDNIVYISLRMGRAVYER